MLERVGLVAGTLTAVLLAACGTGSVIGPGGSGTATDPSGVSSVRPLDATALVGLWRVEATGEEAGAVLRLAADQMSLWRGCGVLLGGWRANSEGLFVSHCARTVG